MKKHRICSREEIELGDRFEDWKVISEEGPNKFRFIQYKVRCMYKKADGKICGNEGLVTGTVLRHGKSRSCAECAKQKAASLRKGKPQRRRQTHSVTMSRIYYRIKTLKDTIKEQEQLIKNQRLEMLKLAKESEILEDYQRFLNYELPILNEQDLKVSYKRYIDIIASVNNKNKD